MAIRRYKWRGTDGDAYDNGALREAMRHNKPLMWFLGISRGVYMPVYPIWLVGEEPAEHQFVVALEDGMREQWSEQVFHPADLALRRQYAEATVKRRLHQPAFRIRVLRAYNGSCALCRLRHPELLDAAHIKEDSDGGEPVVRMASRCARSTIERSTPTSWVFDPTSSCKFVKMF